MTLVCKLNPTPEQVVKIEATLKAFADACNYTNQHGKKINEIRDKYAKTRASLQQKATKGTISTRRHAREDFSLGSTIKSATELFREIASKHPKSTL